MEQTLIWGDERRDSFGGDVDNNVINTMGVRSQGGVQGSAESLLQEQGDSALFLIAKQPTKVGSVETFERNQNC